LLVYLLVVGVGGVGEVHSWRLRGERERGKEKRERRRKSAREFIKLKGVFFPFPLNKNTTIQNVQLTSVAKEKQN
jgi:hypothetical protein